MSRKKPKKHRVRLISGKFYNVHDGSVRGHPGRIEKADYGNDEYISITTHSLTKEEYEKKKAEKSLRKDFVELKERTSKDVYKSFAHKRPFIGTRDDYGENEYPNMSFSPKDKATIQQIKSKTPRLGYWYKRKNKKAFK